MLVVGESRRTPRHTRNALTRPYFFEIIQTLKREFFIRLSVVQGTGGFYLGFLEFHFLRLRIKSHACLVDLDKY